MNDRMKMVAAAALFWDGYNHPAISRALNIDEDKAADLIESASDEMRNGTLFYMKATTDAEGQASSTMTHTHKAGDLGGYRRIPLIARACSGPLCGGVH